MAIASRPAESLYGVGASEKNWEIHDVIMKFNPIKEALHTILQTLLVSLPGAICPSTHISVGLTIRESTPYCILLLK